MVGIGTVLKDDPLLTVRLSGKKRPRQPVRVIVDSCLRIPLDSQIVRTAGQHPTVVATTKAASSSKIQQLISRRLVVWTIRSNPRGQVSLKALMKKLAGHGIVSILLESGPTLNATALQEKIVDRILLFIAPKIIGGQKAPGVVGGEGSPHIRDAQPLKILSLRRLGADLMIEGELTGSE